MHDILTFFNLLQQRQIQHNTCQMSQGPNSTPNTKGISVQSTQNFIIQFFKYKIQDLSKQVSELQDEIQDLRTKNDQTDTCVDIDQKMTQQSLQQKMCLQQMQQHQNICMEQQATQYSKFLDDCLKQYNRYIYDVVRCQHKYITQGKRSQFKKTRDLRRSRDRLKKVIRQNRRNLSYYQNKIESLESQIQASSESNKTTNEIP